MGRTNIFVSLVLFFHTKNLSGCSASSLIACHKMGFQYVGFELDKYYYDLSNKRLEQEKAQMSLFDFVGGVWKRRRDRVKLIYICSPYRAENETILQRNIDYARELTRNALLQGGVPVATHLYMTQCLFPRGYEEKTSPKTCIFEKGGVEFSSVENICRNL